MKFTPKPIRSVLLQNLPRWNKLHWVKALGADIIIDYTTTDFEQVLHDYDVVFDTQGDKILTKSLNVLKRGGQIIRISGPPDLNFAEAIHANWLLKKWFRYSVGQSVAKPNSVVLIIHFYLCSPMERN